MVMNIRQKCLQIGSTAPVRDAVCVCNCRYHSNRTLTAVYCYTKVEHRKCRNTWTMVLIVQWLSVWAHSTEDKTTTNQAHRSALWRSYNAQFAKTATNVFTAREYSISLGSVQLLCATSQKGIWTTEMCGSERVASFWHSHTRDLQLMLFNMSWIAFTPVAMATHIQLSRVGYVFFWNVTKQFACV